MGVPPFLVASSTQAIIAQRLLRRICKECKAEVEADPAICHAADITDEQIAANKFYGGKGCPVCRGGGFRGRIAVYEIMVMNSRLRDLAFRVATTDQIREQAIRDGMHTLMMDGVRKVFSGMSTVDEVLTVAKKTD